jgi:4-diphosphocytidyl-2-C-methyl-D-erythritol kinase
MIIFPNIKINIGLNIVSRREDGYHNIETVFFPINYHDILEILDSDKFESINTGIAIDCPAEENLCVKAFNILQKEYVLPPVKIILHKIVPFGTGLGAGSSNAAHTLILLNNKFNLNISKQELINKASKIGADCAFFIKNTPVFAEGIGNIFTDISLDLTNHYLVLCFPGISVSTPEAYAGCVPHKPEKSLKELVKLPLNQWEKSIKNDFEAKVFQKYNILAEIKQELYDFGAIYAQMSGSGSAIFGIFNNNPDKIKLLKCADYKIVKL